MNSRAPHSDNRLLFGEIESGECQPIERKPIQRVRRTRVMSLSAEEHRRIIYLFDHSGGDADYAADRCGVIGIQRADVLAIALWQTRAELLSMRRSA